MTDKNIIRVSGLHKSFKRGPEEVKVLTGTELEISRGESIAIIGASGTGKSTLLHLLGGLEKPDYGEITYNDIDICNLPDRKLADFRNTQIGFVFQFHFLLPEFTALENVIMPSKVSRTPQKQAKERAEGLLETVGLSHRLTHKPGELSGGEQQRVAIARALMMSPGILLADEPTGDLDPATGAHIIELFEKIRSSMGLVMVVVTHNMELAESMDRTLVLRGGKLEPHVS